MRRPDGTIDVTYRSGLVRRMRLRRADGRIYLDRWGIANERLGRVLLHRMEAPDPGVDLHDHPWWFCSIVLWGGYTEHRAPTRDAPTLAYRADRFERPGAPPSPWGHTRRGDVVRRRWLSVRTMRLDECHTITQLHGRTCWTLVIGGPRRRGWGFYLPEGYMDERRYDETVRAHRRDLWNEVG